MKSGVMIARQLTLAVCDAVMVVLAFLAAYLIRFHTGWIPLIHEAPPLTWYTQPLGIIVLIYLLFFRSIGLYTVRHVRYLQTEFGTIAHGATLASVALMVLSFLYRDTSYSRIVVALAWGLTTCLVIVGRLSANRWLARTQPTPRLLIVGTGPIAAQVVARIHGRGGYRIIGAIRSPGSHAELPGIRLLGGWNELPAWLNRHTVDEILVAEPGLDRAQVMTLINQCEQALVQFRMVPDTLELLTTQNGIPHLDGIPLLSVRESPLNDPWNRFAKRTLDLMVAGAGLVITLPAWGLIAWVIKRDSPGPIFYLQKRVGQDGRSFTIVKFRTMRVGAEQATGPVWATPGDARRTRAGGWLRRWNLDELPQLLNVLRGDMSLVGPRPERPHFVRQFKQDIPRYMARHRIRSGITGWAQIHGLRGDTSIEARTQYDLYYLERWSLWLDCKILWRSLTAVRNAY